LILGIIPARKGSKRIPHKNTKLLCGKPLVSYAIESGQKSTVDRLMVSTDDPRVMEICKEYGVEVIVRPDYLATDEATTLDAVLHVVENIDYIPDIVVILEPTSPLRTASDIRTMKSLLDGNDSLACPSLGIFMVKWNTLKSRTLTGKRHIHVNSDGIDINDEKDWEKAEHALQGD